jgi:hypothetical protein
VKRPAIQHIAPRRSTREAPGASEVLTRTLRPKDLQFLFCRSVDIDTVRGLMPGILLCCRPARLPTEERNTSSSWIRLHPHADYYDDSHEQAHAHKEQIPSTTPKYTVSAGPRDNNGEHNSFLYC